MVELGQLERYYERVSAEGIELVAISTDEPANSRQLRERLSVNFKFLSDPGAKLLEALGIRHEDPHALEQYGRESIAFPTMMLVDALGKIRWIFQTDSIRSRANPDDVLSAVADMLG